MVSDFIHDAFASAWDAAAAVPQPEGMDDRTHAFAKRAAAEAALKRALGGLGLNVQGLTLGPPEGDTDLAALAGPLQVP
ncbi:hypothetical protein MNEG_8457 [Monoraphidium neglectum]|uniref:Uncharacterized protein n=1 Tax=Monoraphidium neglectum TaxID=145388 RepID=A0A0D2M838_9CHLO|nr:hypothetical protein MNEG_8457 [Monoraphidium neglectum]KIY99504.1 hypothetical protein MNEG_8457 [Monoraphidium neglectum]|eukprot:XP_013898524.1 hypothetical protein MNEG_8457 [Monoraphidium neglectum]